MDEMFAGLLNEDFEQLNFEQAAKLYFSWFMKLNLPWPINNSVQLLLNIFEVMLDFTLCLSQISCMMKA
jgi:hypothetical protein